MVIDLFTKQIIPEEEKEIQNLTIRDLVTYLNSFGQDLQQVLDFQIIIGDNLAKEVELTPEGLIIK